jgi:hypothetical protein
VTSEVLQRPHNCKEALNLILASYPLHWKLDRQHHVQLQLQLLHLSVKTFGIQLLVHGLVFNPPQQYLLVTTFGFQIALIVALIV